MALEWNIRPYKGLGQLEFGMSRAHINQLLKVEPKLFRKSPSSLNYTDSYESFGFHLYYDEEDRLNFIEAFPPCDAVYRGMRFLGVDISGALEMAKSIGLDAETDKKETKCVFEGFSLWIIDVVESISVYPLDSPP